MAKNKIVMGFADDPKSMKDITGAHRSGRGWYQGTTDVIKTAEDEPLDYSEPAKVLSNQDHPMELSYNGDAFMLPPRGNVLVGNKKLLGAIPRGVFIVPAPELKR